MNCYVFIVNPTSGKGKGLIASKIIKEYCDNNKINYKIVYTTKNNSAIDIAKQYSISQNNIIYSVGGDGTLNEVINGIVFPKRNINITPVGSGNDFYKTIKESKEITADVGVVNNRKFMNIASIGLDANIANRANKLKKYKLPSNSIYLLGLTKEFGSYKGNNITINGSKFNNNILAICNGKYYGGGFNIGVLADISDGLFDVCQIGYKNKLNSLKLLLKLVNENHYKDKEVKYYNSKNIIVDSDEVIPCNVDGEIIFDSHFEFGIIPKFINIGSDPLNINEILKSKKLIK